MDDIGEVYNRYARDVYRYLLSLSHNPDVSEELMQETFLRAMKTLDHYDGSCKLYVWLCQIAKHIWYQYVRKHAGKETVELREDLISENTTEENVLQRMERMDLYQVIHALPDEMREVVYLRLTGEFSFQEIGEITGHNENWARVTYYRARQKIAEKWRKGE